MGVMDRYKNKKKDESEGTTTTKKGVAERYELNKGVDFDSYEVNQDFINTFMSDASNFLSSAESDYNGIGWSNASSSYDSRYNTWKDLYSRATVARRWLDNNKANLDQDTYNSLIEALDSVSGGMSSVLDTFKSAKDYYSQWETEDAYNSWLQQEEEIKSIPNAEDFEEYFSAGEAKKEKDKWWKGRENNVAYLRDPSNLEAYESGANSANGASWGVVENTLLDSLDYKAAKYMTDEEYKAYNYYVGKGETEKAESYLKSLEETLTRRQAGELVSDIQGNKLKEVFFAVESGLDQFMSGVGNLDNFIMGTEGDVASATQMASSEIRAGIDGLGGVAYDLAQTTANMLPSILVGAATGGVGSLATMGAGIAGNAYSEMRSLGYDEWQARGYATLVTAAELGLQKALGGISMLGGGNSGIFQTVASKVVPKLDNAIARVAIQLGGNMLDEGLEEAIQEVLDPVFKMIATGEDFEGIDLEAVLYSGLLGALSAGVMEGAPSIAGTVGSNIAAKKTYGYNDGVDLIYELLSIDPDNAYARKMKARLDAGQNVSGYQLNRLVEANESALVSQDKGKMKSAVESRLKELGESGDVGKLAEVIVKSQVGEKLTSAERKALSDSTYGEWVSEELNPDSVNKGFGEDYSNWAETIGTKRINSEAYNKGIVADQTAIQSRNITAAESPQPTLEGKADTKVNVSESGTTMVGDVEVKIEEIASVKDGKITLKLDSGETVDYADVAFGTEEEGLLYENVADMGLNAATANAFVKGYDPSEGLSVQEYALGFREAYRYGEYGFPVQEMSKEGFSASLSEAKKTLAYNLGKTDAKHKIKAAEKALPKARADAKFAKGTMSMEEAMSKEGLTDIQRESLNGIKAVADSLGTKIRFFESEIGADGKRKGANGWFDPGTGVIYIDIYAGQNGEGTMLFTAAHELTHFIRVWSPAKFKVFADFLLSEYGKKGVSVDALVRQQIQKAKKNGRDISYDTAYEEVIADSCETMLADGKAISKIAKLKAQDQTLWAKIKDFITDLVAKIKNVYKGLTPNSPEGRYVAEMLDAATKLKNLWTKALVDASTNYEASIGERNLSDFAEAKNENGEPLFQYRAMEADEGTYRQMLSKWGKLSSVQIDNLFSTIDNAMELIKDNLEALDYAWEADIDDRAFSPVKPNSDKLYQVSLDFSTLCRKRLLQQMVQEQLQEALNKPLTREEGIAIRDALIALQEEGRQIEVACALCYVESARMKSPEQIKRFMENKEKVIKEFFAGKSGGNIKDNIKQAEADAKEKLHKENPGGILGKDGKTKLDPRNASLKQLPKKYADVIRDAKRAAKESYKPTAEEQNLIDVAKSMTVSDFTSPEGLENLAKKYPRLFDAYTSYVRNATKSKGIEGDTWWRAGDSAKIGDVLIANMNRENGMRSQSWSDFQVIHILDYIASTIELATRNAKEQAYSKVPDYVELMGQTGVMINMSLIPTAAFNGSLDYDSVEGIDYKRALELRDKYHKTAGTICIGVNNKQIQLLLEEATIDYVIPYHKSGMSKAVRKLMHIPTWDQYEEHQSEKSLPRAEAKKRADKYGATLLPESDPNYHKALAFSDWFDLKEAQQIAKMENANPTDKAMQKKYGVMYGGYKAMQNAANNYLKMTAARGLSPKFSHEKADFSVEDNYWKLLIDRKMVDNVTGEIIEQQTIKPIFNEGEVMRILNDEVARYPKVKADQDYAIRKVTEKMLSGEVKGGMSAEAIAKVMKKPVDNVTNVNILASAEDMKLSDRDSHGNELSAGQIEFFKDSKARDEEGNLLVLYHGTSTEQRITEFMTTEGWRTGLWLSTDHATAVHFARATEYLENDPRDETRLFTKENSSEGTGRQGVYELYANLKNPLIVDANSKRYWEIPRPSAMGKGDAVSGEEINRFALENGYDGVIINDVIEGSNRLGTDVIVFSPNQAKYTDNLNPTESNDIRYSHRVASDEKQFNSEGKTLDEQLEDILSTSESFDGRYLYIGRFTSDFIDMVKPYAEMKDLPVAMNYRDAYLSMENKEHGKYKGGDINYHNLGKEGLKSAIESFGSPEQVLLSKKEGKVELVLQGVDQKGNRLLSIVALNTNARNSKKYIEAHIVTSIYGRRSIERYIDAAEKEGRLIYNKKEESTQVNSQVQYEGIVNANSSVGSIPQDTENVNRKFSDREKSSYAPTFYSHMGNVIDGIKIEKMGANGVVPYLKGRGVKDEEIKWSGIETFLEGKKSVTKAELQEFVAGSQLRIEETISGINNEAYAELDSLWREYFDNQLEDTFDPEDFDSLKVRAELAVLEDMEYDMPSEEIQERMVELAESIGKPTKWDDYKLEGGENYRELLFKMPDSTYSNRAMRGHWGQDAEGILVHTRVQDFEVNGKTMLFIEELQSDWHNEGLEKGYTTKEYEDALAVYDRLAEDYANKRRAFNQYVRSSEFRSDSDEVGKKKFDWLRRKMDTAEKRMQDAERDIEALKAKGMGDVQDAPFRSTYHEYVLKRLLRMAAEEGYDSIGWTIADTQSKRWSYDYEKAYQIEYDQEMPKFLRKYGKKWGTTVGKSSIGDTEVWSMDISDSMKDSVLYEGQVLYSERDADSVSNRSLLAGALESVAQNDVERNKLEQYKQKIALIESEQKKLAELREKIKELSFAKGARDTEAIKKLQFEANQAASRINTYDKQLLTLESTKALKGVLEREKEMARKREAQRGKDALNAYKEKAAKTQRELLSRYQESRKNSIESRHKTEMRHKIKNVVSDLNKLLVNPTKEQHVPIGLQRVVAEALDAINMDTMNAEERVAHYDALIAKATDPDEIAALTKKRDFFAYRDANFKDRINALKNAYAEFKESDDPLVRNAHNEAIENLIKNTADEVGNKSLKDMSLAQLEAVYDMYKAILATVRNTNKMFKEGRQETITENSEAVKTEVKTVGGHKERINKLTKGIKNFNWNLLKPIYAMKTIGSDTLTSLYENVRAGEDTYAVDVTEAKTFFEEVSKKYGYDSWDYKKQISFKDSVGNEFSLSLEQIMSLYAYSKREQADQHLEFGGFVFDDSIEVTEKKLGIPIKYEVNDANPYRLRKEDLATVISSLTTEQKGFIDEMQTYLSDVMGAKGNEVSLAMYDIKFFKEKHYFPLKTSRYFREYNPEQGGNPMLRNSGFTKKTVPNAGNPIVLSNFMDVWTSHVNDMSMYHSFVLPLEDFMRVYNYSSTAGGYDSVQQYIKNAYGAEANKYVEKLMQDINGGVVSGNIQNGWLKMFSKFKKATVAASLSTIVQQPTAVIRAMGEVNPVHFVGVPFKGGHKKTWNEIKQYAPVAIIKEMGGFDVGSGRQAKEYIASERKGFIGKAAKKIDDAFMWGATKADEYGWNTIWKAVKREVASKQKLKPGTDEFYKACSKRFTEVITQTQVYDSVFSRSGLMRDKGDLNKFATSFMGEPTTSYNMLYGAVLDAKRGGSKIKAVGKVASVFASIVAASAAAAAIYALRDDDEDESYAEKYAEAFGNKLSSEIWIHNMIPYVRDVASILQGWDVERPDMSIFSDIKSSFDKLYKVNEDGEFEWRIDFSNPKEVYSAIENFGGSIAAAFGVPVKNIMRDTRGIYNGVKAISDDIEPNYVGDAFVRGFTGDKKDKSEALYNAIVNGDEGRLEAYRSGYKDEDAYETAVRKALRENDPRIKEAAQARYDGDIAEYKRIAKAIIAEGNFVQDTVVGAINSEITVIKKGESIEEVTTEDEDEATSIYKASDINDALDNGNNDLALEIIDDLIATKVANGMDETSARSSLRSSMTSYWKPIYKEAYASGNTSEMERIRKILYASGLYGSANEVVKSAAAWLKD